jgi:hypothetical protein
MATHARLLDRRRFELLVSEGNADAVLTALEAYRNPDGGYGHGLEPDLRSTTSQTGSALHAFEVFESIAPITSPRAVELCDWLSSVSLPDGGIPFALPIPDPAGCAPFWVGADSSVSSYRSRLWLRLWLIVSQARLERGATPWLAEHTILPQGSTRWSKPHALS